MIVKQKRISVVVNIYIDVNHNKENPFDHPTDFVNFQQDNTFGKFYNSIKNLKVPTDHELVLLIFAIAANNEQSKDDKIKSEINSILGNGNVKACIITNSEIEELRRNGLMFLSTEGYCEIRNLGFIFGYFNDSDYLIQFDDDEIIPENYILKMLDLYETYPEIYSLNSLYEKDGIVTVNDSSDFECWKKLAYMNQDFHRLSDSDKPVESIFGLGGNMTFRKEFFSKICYPQSVRRGEDFALLLAARLIYENGNQRCNIFPHEKAFVSYFTSEEDMIIAHRPPKGHAKKHRLKNDFLRFANQRALMGDKLAENKLYDLSRYMYYMLVVGDYLSLVKSVYAEAAKHEPELYTSEFIENEINDIAAALKALDKRNLFEEYKEYQAEYLELLSSDKAAMEVKKILQV